MNHQVLMEKETDAKRFGESDPLNEKGIKCEKQERPNVFSRCGARYFQAVLMLAAMAASYMMRVNMSIAVVPMVGKNSTSGAYGGYETFDWGPKEVGTLFSSFFIGYCTSNLVAGFLTSKFSNKWLLELSLLFSSLTTLIVPYVAVNWGYTALIFLRLSLGVFQSLLVPTTFGQLSRWVPPVERVTFTTLVFGGIQIGTSLMFVSGGVLASGPGGWPSIFYVSGGVGLVWCVLWAVFGAESPATTKLISDYERKFIISSLATEKTPEKLPIPWKKMFTNPPCYALTITFFVFNIGFWTLLSEMPIYSNFILKYNLTSTGWITALPYLLQVIVSLGMSHVAKFLIKKGITSTTTSRKLCNTIGQWGGGAALVVLCHITDKKAVLVAYMTCVTIMGISPLGFNVNTLDLSPNFTGCLTGLVNGVGNVASLIAPLYAGLIVSNYESVEQWRIVFYTSAVALFLGNTVFLIWGTSKIQDFNYAQDDQKKEEPSEQKA